MFAMLRRPKQMRGPQLWQITCLACINRSFPRSLLRRGYQGRPIGCSQPWENSAKLCGVGRTQVGRHSNRGSIPAAEGAAGHPPALPTAPNPAARRLDAPAPYAALTRQTRPSLTGLRGRSGRCGQLTSGLGSFCCCGAGEVGDFRASSLNTLVQMVAGGIGVALLPRLSLEVESRPPSPIIIRPFQKPEPSRTIGLVWRTTSAREHEFRLLAKLLVV